MGERRLRYCRVGTATALGLTDEGESEEEGESVGKPKHGLSTWHGSVSFPRSHVAAALSWLCYSVSSCCRGPFEDTQDSNSRRFPL